MSAARDIWASSSKTIISTIPRVFLDENINTTSFTVHLLTAKNLKIALNHLNENESEVLNHSDEHELFFSAYTALVAHFLCSEINSLDKSDLNEVQGACRVLLKFFLSRITKKSDNCTISKKQLAILIKSLCRGTSGLTKMDVSMLVTHLIFAQFPDDKKEEDTTSAEAASTEPETAVKSTPVAPGTPKWSSYLEGTGQLEPVQAYEKMMLIFEEASTSVTGGISKQKLKKVSQGSLKVLKSDRDLYSYVPVNKQAKEQAEETSAMATKLTSEETSKSNMTSSFSSHEMQDVMASRCLRMLQRELHGNDVLLNVCSNLPALKRFEIALFTSANVDSSDTPLVDFSWPTSHSEAAHVVSKFQQVLTATSLVSRLFSLPILEPLTTTRLQTIINITTSCLHAAISATIATGIVWSGNKTASKEEDAENYATSIVQKSIDIFNLVSVSIEKSSKAGGAVYQNYHLMGAWTIFKGLQSVLFLHSTLASTTGVQKASKSGDGVAKSKDKAQSKEGKKTVGGQDDTKFPINFNPLFVALIGQALKSLHIVLSDLEVESLTSVYDVNKEEINEEINLFECYSAIQRTRKLTKSIYFSNLFHFLLSHLFKKGLALGKLNSLEKGKASSEKGTSKGEGSSKEGKEKDTEDTGTTLAGKDKEGHSFDADSNSSDSNTFYEEEFSSSQDDISFEDDNSESNLNHWFEEVPAIDVPSTDDKKTDKTAADTDTNKSSRMSRRHSNNDLPGAERKEADAYIRAGIDVIGTLMRHFINSPCSELVEHFSTTLTDDHVAQLAGIIKDLDHEQEQQALSASTFPDAELLFESFSKSLSFYVHALISRGLINEPLQLSLLDNLHVSIRPQCTEQPQGAAWPLKILPRTLSVLIQVIMLKQKQEKVEEESDKGSVIISGPVAIKNIWFKFAGALFENITAQSAISATEPSQSAVEVDDVNVEQLQALLFLFHQLELAQKKAIWQHFCTVFVNLSDISDDKIRYLNPILITRFFQLIEYLLKKFYQYPPNLTEQVATNIFGVFAASTKVTGKFYSNRFYELCASSEYNNQESPKVDGLACAFILIGVESLVYNKFYATVVSLMSTGSSIVDPDEKHYRQLSQCLFYHLSTSHRLLSILPPSVEFLRKLEQGVPVFNDGQLLLHTFKWISRMNVEPFQTWTLDFLLKQRLMQRRASELMTKVIKFYGTSAADATCCVQFLQDALMPDDLTPLKQLDLFKLCTIDMVLFRIHALLDPPYQKSNICWHKPTSEQLTISKGKYCQLFALVTRLLEKIAEAAKEYLFSLVIKRSQQDSKSSSGDGEAGSLSLWDLRHMMSVNSSKNPHINLFTSAPIFSTKHNHLEVVLDKWSNTLLSAFPQIFSWKMSPVSKDIIPVESYLDLLLKGHLASISLGGEGSADEHFNIMPSLKHLLLLSVKILNQLLSKDIKYEETELLFDILAKLSCHASMEFLDDVIIERVEKKLEGKNSVALKCLVFAAEVCHKVICKHGPSTLDDHLLKCRDALKFLTSLTQKPLGLQALNTFYSTDKHLVALFKSVARCKEATSHGVLVLKYLDTLLTCVADKQADASATTDARSEYSTIFESFEELTDEGMDGLHLLLVPEALKKEAEKTFEERRNSFLALLTHLAETQCISRSFISELFKHTSSCTSQLLPPSRDARGFSQLMPVLNTLATNDQDKCTLFSLCLKWIEQCKAFVAQKNVLEKLQATSSKQHQEVIGAMCVLLGWVKEVVASCRQGERTRCYSGLMEADSRSYFSSLFENDVIEDTNTADDDSNEEDSDDDSLNNKLCTFVYTKKEFMSQHWYHCHTCKMIEGVGVCSVCAKVCHQGHDISYAKYGSFFCDCGEKGPNGNCRALTKRVTQQPPPGQSSTAQAASTSKGHHKQLKQSNLVSFFNNVLVAKSDDKKTPKSSTTAAATTTTTTTDVATKQPLRVVSPAQNKRYTQEVKEKQSVETLVSLLKVMMPAAEDFYHQSSSFGQLQRTKAALHELHTSSKSIDSSHTFFSPIISSQEGTLDNVKLTYQGDQGQVLRQLLSSYMLRRVSMCLLSSPYSRRQHLAVSNDKGKVTLLQLSSLLKMAHSGKKKLVVSRLCMLSIPFNIISLTNCPANEDFMAVCGLKDCHVLTFNASGSVVGHLALQLALDTGNHIIKAMWLPGSQCELAIVTADFVKIFDLATDAISPHYYMLLAVGMIQDVTFVCGNAATTTAAAAAGKEKEKEEEDGRDGDDDKESGPTDRHIVIMSVLGHLSTARLHEKTNARSGMFYITKKIAMAHADIKESSSGVMLGGGASVYYSHTLKLLFFSFMHGKNFVGHLDSSLSELHNLVVIPFKPLTSSKQSGSGSGSQSAQHTLVQWSEVYGHPGLVSSVCQASNNPVVLLIKPDSIWLQEVEVAKLKVQDFVLTRHSFHHADDASDTSVDHRVTSMVVLCADGSMRILNADAALTDQWVNMTSCLPPVSSSATLTSSFTSKPPKKRTKQSSESAKSQTGPSSIPADFFEHSKLFSLNDIEFGGKELLRYYNVAQLRSRLNTAGLYIASISATGFELEVMNLNSATCVMVGIRVSVGNQSTERAPTSIGVFNRSIPINCSYPRWYDIPFTREESLGADKTLVIKFGVSRDAGHVVMVDSVKVYYKSKASFNWPEEVLKEPVVAPAGTSGAVALVDAQSQAPSKHLHTPFDRLLMHSLELLDECLVFSDPFLLLPLKQPLLDLTTRLLSLPTPDSLHQQAKSLMSSLFSSKTAYYWHKDHIQLGLLLKCLDDFEREDLVVVATVRQYLYTACAIAHHRPDNLLNFVYSLPPPPASFDGSGGDDDDDARKGDKKTDEEEDMKAGKSDVDEKVVGVGEKVGVSEQVGVGEKVTGGEKEAVKEGSKDADKARYFLHRLNKLFWHVVSLSSYNPLTSAVTASETIDEEMFVSAMVKIMQAFLLSNKTPVDKATTTSTTATAIATATTKTATTTTVAAVTTKVTTTTLVAASKTTTTITSRPLSAPSSSTKATTLTTKAPSHRSGGGKNSSHSHCGVDHKLLTQTVKHYISMIFSENVKISHACKNVLLRSMRPRLSAKKAPKETPPEAETPQNQSTCSTTTTTPAATTATIGTTATAAPTTSTTLSNLEHDVDELEAPGNSGATTSQGRSPSASALDSLLEEGRRGTNLQALLSINPSLDVDDTMVQLAIALSLQDQNQEGAVETGQLEGQQEAAGGSHLSDTTVSDNNEDEEDEEEEEEEEEEEALVEGDSVVVDTTECPDPLMYSLMHKNQLSAEASDDTSDSNTGSVSVGGWSSATDLGHLSACKRNKKDKKKEAKMQRGDDHKEARSTDTDDDDDEDGHLKALRMSMLEALIDHLPELGRQKGYTGVLPFLQLVVGLTISSDMWRHDRVLQKLLQGLLSFLHLHPLKPEMVAKLQQLSKDQVANTSLMDRSDAWVVRLLVVSTLMVFLSYKTMTWMFCPSSCDGETPSQELLQKAKKRHDMYAYAIQEFTCWFMKDKCLVEYCLYHLHALLHSNHPLVDPPSDAIDVTEMGPQLGQVLKPRQLTNPPDLQPFFFSSSTDLYSNLHSFLIETLIRVPFHMKYWFGDSLTFSHHWVPLLAELRANHQSSSIRHKVRKVMLVMCGSKENYRLSRDFYYLANHIDSVKSICEDKGLDVASLDSMDGHSSALTTHLNLPYDLLISVVEHLKLCMQVASQRTSNWQKFCEQNPSIVPFLMAASISFDSGVSPMFLQLLQHIIKPPSPSSSSSSSSDQAVRASSEHKGAGKNKKDSKTPKVANTSDTEGTQAANESDVSHSLVQKLFASINPALLKRFIVCFLLESNQTSTRWLAHSLLYNIHQYSSVEQKEKLIDLVWQVWPSLHLYGSRSAQFVDLLGYFTIKLTQLPEAKLKSYVERAICLMRTENKVLANHPNANVYNALEGLVDFGGYYLERDPCLVCNNPEEPFSNFKLSTVKVDSKFTTSSQIVKLVCSHTISKFTLKINDLKKSKMVKTLIIYYNNKQVQAILELKNKPALWHRAKKVTLSQGQTEVKVEFALPIVACNLMIEFAEFYDNAQATSETLQCPRCSASVPAVPGVCSNCGENVFQCHKCRAINYDEKDPFLCNTCGYCKYAKFDFVMTAKQCCTVEPIENEEDRKKAVSMINSYLESADVLYKEVQCLKALFDELLIKMSDHQTVSFRSETTAPPPSQSNAVSVNKSLQQLALKYCNDCRQAFEALSAMIQKVLAYRKELVEYDHQQQKLALFSTPMTSSMSSASMAPLNTQAEEASKSSVVLREKRSQQQCYGCAIASVEQCITLLRAMSTNAQLKDFLCSQGLIVELFNYNLRRGSAVIRSEARHLLCLMSTNHPQSTSSLLLLLQSNVEAAMHKHYLLPDFSAAVRHEMLVLSHLLKIDDSLWEQRLRCVMKLFRSSTKYDSPSVQEFVSLPCLCILQQLTKAPSSKPPSTPSSKLHKKNRVQESSQGAPPLLQPPVQLTTNFEAWMQNDKEASFEAWVKRLPVSRAQPPHSSTLQRRKKELKGRVEIHERMLMEKYLQKWRFKAKLRNSKLNDMHFSKGSWMSKALFSATSANIRATQCAIIEDYCRVPGRKQAIIDMLTSCLGEVGVNGEASSEYLALYKKLISGVHWRYYLALKGTLLRICQLIKEEIEELQRQEVLSLSSDLSQGFTLNALTNLLADFLEVERIRHHYKNKLVGSVLDGYLSLKKLVVQRTKLIDDTQEKLLKLLEEMTTGTEQETRQFMAVCVETVNKYPLSDHISPVFIFERLCNIIYPKNNDAKDFQLSLEKDAQQEDFLQGRMLGNPYNSTEPGLGPLMRDVKNKICQDCDLVALLEDDTGMELLVSNKIISLDLAVKDVYKRIWLADHSDTEAMRIVYRMRGLLGDATEDMVNSLETRKDSDVDCEEVYRMASVMGECNGLKVMLDRLAMIRNLVTGKQLMVVLLKLFTYCLKLKSNKQQLLRVDMQCITKMLGALNLALLAEQENSVSTKGQTLTEQLLQIMEVILLEASTHQPLDVYKQFSKCCGDKDQLMMLLDRINSPFVRSNPSVLQALMRLIPFLAYGDDDKMMALINHFKPYMHFERYDKEHTEDEQIHLDCFCSITQGIENNANGRRLKDLMASHSTFVEDCLTHILKYSPTTTGSSILIENKAWKDLISKASLPFVLRILTGLCTGHDPIKMRLVKIIPTLHTLEQISSDERVGSLAENLLEAMKENPEVAKEIEDFRKQTKAEKKRMAMAMRKKQLNQLGMMTNEKGQLKVNKDLVEGHNMEALKEEVGLVCCICREGYKNQPNKVLSIYTFSKRVNLDDFENRTRRTIGYSTVTHFNIVHYDCHLAAVRHARARDEWESAALQNGNTKCNGLLPLWGPDVLESAFASCLARHNGYLQENTGIRDTTHLHTVHDLKHLLLKFAFEKSFSEDSGGGGKSSNVHLIPYLVHTALYVINMTRSEFREEKSLSNFLKAPAEKVLESCYETEGALYWTVMACHLQDRDVWMRERVVFLARLLVLAHVRNLSSSPVTSISDKRLKDFSVYKPYLMLFSLVHCMYERLFKNVKQDSGKSWPVSLAEYIRNNDQPLADSCKLLLSDFEDKFLVCTSLQEFCAAADLSDKIPDGSSWLQHMISFFP